MKKSHSIARAVIVALIFVWVALLLNSCTATRPNYYQNHLKSTHHNNWVQRDNGGCAWAN